MNLSIQEAQPTLLQPPEHYLTYIDSKTLAARWGLPETWIRDQVRRRSADPLPHIRFGKYVRFRWGSPELEAWAERRVVGLGKAVRVHKKEVIQ